MNSAAGHRASERRIPIYLFMALLFLYVLSASFRIDSGDSESMYQVAESLSRLQGFAIPVSPKQEDSFGPQGELEPVASFQGGDGYGAWGRGGRYYSKYGPGWSIAAAPLVLVGRTISRLTGLFTPGYLGRCFALLLNPLLIAGSAVVIYRLLRRDHPVRWAVGGALTFGVATYAWDYASSGFSEPLVTFLLALGLLWIEGQRSVLAGACLGGALLTRQTAVFAVVPMLAWALWRSRRVEAWNRRRQAVHLVAPVIVSQLLFLSFNYARFGSILELGYQRGSWDAHLGESIYGLLLSPGKGLFVYSPILLLAVAGWFGMKSVERKVLLPAVCLPFFLPHALYTNWSGGGGWGPRFLLPTLPFLMLALPPGVERLNRGRWGRLVLALLLAASVMIQLLSITVNWGRHLQRTLEASSTPEVYIQRVLFDWRYAPVLGQFQSLREVAANLRDPRARRQLAGMVHAGQATETRDWQTESIGYLAFNVPDFWFVYFWFLGVPPAVLIVTLGLIGAACALSAGRLRSQVLRSLGASRQSGD